MRPRVIPRRNRRQQQGIRSHTAVSRRPGGRPLAGPRLRRTTSVRRLVITRGTPPRKRVAAQQAGAVAGTQDLAGV